jgi:hypothetical protein
MTVSLAIERQALLAIQCTLYLQKLLLSIGRAYLIAHVETQGSKGCREYNENRDGRDIIVVFTTFEALRSRRSRLKT